jgi:hypothetical protein
MRKEHIPGYLFVVLLVAASFYVFFVIGPSKHNQQNISGKSGSTATVKK